ncbi:hypothetical protein [Nocardia sp. NPDC004604]|uniref:hypothetical protein n=1 Tax=Nocardia sp. NPDC004604 TaxID=3157013 RepID=UPI0033B2F808
MTTVDAGPFDPRRFEDRFRSAMRAIADSDRALEMNTRRLWPWIPQWWREEGGHAVTFGSDTPVPEALADNFLEAMAMVEHFGSLDRLSAESALFRSRHHPTRQTRLRQQHRYGEGQDNHSHTFDQAFHAFSYLWMASKSIRVAVANP